MNGGRESLFSFRSCRLCVKVPDGVGGTCQGCGTVWVPDELGTLQRVDVQAFDRESEAYVRKTLGWEFDVLQLNQAADEAMRDD